MSALPPEEGLLTPGGAIVGRKRKPSPDRKRIADLESKLFQSERLLVERDCEIDSLKSRLALARQSAKESRRQLKRLRDTVLHRPPPDEGPP